MNMLEKYNKILLYIFFLGIFLYFLFSLFHIITTFAPDFNVYYRSGYDLLHHKPLYADKHAFTNFGYPPITAIVYVPFALLPYQLAQGIYIALSGCALFLCVYLTLTLLQKKTSITTLLITSSFFILSFPTKFTLGMGQSNLLAYASLLLSILLYKKGEKIIWIVIFLSLACILKPLFIFFLLFFLLEKQWKIFIATILCLCIVTGSMFLLFSTSFTETIHYLIKILPEMMNTQGREVYYNQGLMGFIFRTFGEGILQKYVAEISASLLLIATIIFCRKKETVTKFAFFCSVLPLADSLSWQHHFVILLFPFVYLFFLLQKKGNRILSFLLGVSYGLVSGNIKTPEILIMFPSTVILSHTFYGGFLLWILLSFIFLRKINIVTLPGVTLDSNIL